MPSAIKCCCAPSWRSRSILRRSASPVATMRARVARSSVVRRLELGRQTTVLDGQQQRLTRGCDELWVGVQSRVVPDHRHGFAVPRDRSRRLARRRRGRKRLAARVDKAAGLLESEPELERRIIECIGQRRAQLSGARVLYQAGDDLLQRRRGEERAHHDRKHKSVGKQGATNRRGTSRRPRSCWDPDRDDRRRCRGRSGRAPQASRRVRRRE